MKSIKIRCGNCGLLNSAGDRFCQRCKTQIAEGVNLDRVLLNGAQLWGVDSEHPELLPPNTFFPDPDDRRSDHPLDYSQRPASYFENPDDPPIGE